MSGETARLMKRKRRRRRATFQPPAAARPFEKWDPEKQRVQGWLDAAVNAAFKKFNPGKRGRQARPTTQGEVPNE